MIIKASSKDYEVTVNNNFDVIEKLQIDKDTYVVIDKKLYLSLIHISEPTRH